MSNSDKTQQDQVITITLTLPETENGTLLIQRGDLAHIHQFSCTDIYDIAQAIQNAVQALETVESNPPVVPDVKPETPKSTTKAAAKQEPEEPTIAIPLKKGSVEIKISHLKIVSGETDAAAYRQAVLIAGRLIDGKLWDGKTPIRFEDVYAVQKRIKHLSDKELSLFSLEDFALVGSNSSDTPSETFDDNHDEDAPIQTNTETSESARLL